MITFGRKRQPQPDIPRDERLVAVGNLTGTEPSKLIGYVLLAFEDGSGEIRISTDMCKHEMAVGLASALKLVVHATGEEAHEQGVRP